MNIKKIILSDNDRKKYFDNEDINYHTENIVLLAEISWNKRLISISKAIQAIHEANGSIPYDIYNYRMKIEEELLELVEIGEN